MDEKEKARVVEVRAVGRDVLKIQGERVITIHCVSERAADRVAAHVALQAIRAGIRVVA